VINAGDGGHHHPTQTLTDLLTIKRLLGCSGDTGLKDGVRGLTVGFCGDLTFGRTVHSLAKALARYQGLRFIFVSPPELRVPGYITRLLEKEGVEYQETVSLEEAMPHLDVLYMTRVQRERFFNEEDYIRLKDTYVLTLEKMESAKKKLIILHPLPRVNEIAIEVDADPRAAYFRQMKYGMYVRMALLTSILGVVSC
jgi:aspartate carbamoyltransferase catalytic subunit